MIGVARFGSVGDRLALSAHVRMSERRRVRRCCEQVEVDDPIVKGGRFATMEVIGAGLALAQRQMSCLGTFGERATDLIQMRSAGR